MGGGAGAPRGNPRTQPAHRERYRGNAPGIEIKITPGHVSYGLPYLSLKRRCTEKDERELITGSSPGHAARDRQYLSLKKRCTGDPTRTDHRSTPRARPKMPPVPLTEETLHGGLTGTDHRSAEQTG